MLLQRVLLQSETSEPSDLVETVRDETLVETAHILCLRKTNDRRWGRWDLNEGVMAGSPMLSYIRPCFHTSPFIKTHSKCRTPSSSGPGLGWAQRWSS